MSVKKGKPKPLIAPIIRPGQPTARLMDNQDTRRKGDSTGADRVQITFWTTPERKAEMKAYAAAHDMTLTRLIVEGIEMRMRRK